MKDKEPASVLQRKGLPHTFRFNPFLRWVTLLFATLALAYSLYVLVSGRIGADTSTFLKIVPFLIMFLAFNSILKNLLSLNSIRFEPSGIRFGCLARPTVHIGWKQLERMEFVEGKIRLIRLQYEQDGQKKKYDFSINFPNMLEIVNGIDEMAPHIEVDTFLENVLVRRKHRPRPVEVKRPENDGS